MERALSIEDVRRAWAAKDGDLADLIVALASQPDTPPGDAPPPRPGALTLVSFAAEIQGRAFRKKPKEEQAHRRIEALRALESPSAEVALPDRARLGEVILDLWADNSAFARDVLLDVIARAHLRWGPWRAFKRIFKEAESARDWDVFGALAARIDAALANSAAFTAEISRRTLAYLARRAWRALRRTAEALPAAYPDAAAAVLSAYGPETRWTGTWIYNHIVFHETKKYTRRSFHLDRKTHSLLQYRAYGELWRRTPRPLFGLLERASCDQARSFAVAALKADFRAALREVEPAWVARLVFVKSAAVDEFVVWLLANVPRFEQGSFRALGLHAPVIALLDSPSNEAQSYAAAYARTHARDLPLEALIRLCNSGSDEVRKLARDLLQDRDPRKDIGLEGWGSLLGTQYGHELAAAALRKHFGARELTPAWFLARLLSPNPVVFAFAAELFGRVHAAKDLGAGFFFDLLDDPRLTPAAARFALDAIARFPEGDVDVERLRRALLHPLTSAQVAAWIEEDRIKPKTLGVGIWRALAYPPTWDQDPWVRALIGDRGRPWARDLAFSEKLAALARKVLGDVRRFSPADLGKDWLLGLAASADEGARDFAAEYMIKAFVPADFAPAGAEAVAPAAAAAAPAPAAAAAPADLGGKSFLFTGKLATMQRGDATKKVSGASGKNASAVNAKLDYLVIGDDGSPLYGAGRKGSKQLAAEKLIGEGAKIAIISETAFLKMLAGEKTEVTSDAAEAGCAWLWERIAEPGPADAPIRAFAMRYARRHHPGISLATTDRPVDPGAEIPASFLTFDRVRPLLLDARAPVRAFALDLARYELARWKPPIEAVVALFEAPHADVRAFLADALLTGDEKERQSYRIDPKTLTASAVYSFCESLDEGTRALGMKLVARDPSLAAPEELFRLAESPDRQVRAFVVKTLWGLYRERGITLRWRPSPPVVPSIGKPDGKPGAASKGASALEPKVTSPAPAPVSSFGAPLRPEGKPAGDEALRDFLRRALFTVPPGRLPKGQVEPTVATPGTPAGAPASARRIRPLPARKAKLALIEALRDLAVRDAAFASVVAPLFEEFMGSRGESEKKACLVALTRIQRAHPAMQKDAA